MKDPKGRVAGDLCGTRLALAEELLDYAERKEPERKNVGAADVIEIPSDSEDEL